MRGAKARDTAEMTLGNDHLLEPMSPAVLRKHRQWAVRIGPVAASYRSDRMLDSWTQRRLGIKKQRRAVVPFAVALIALIGAAAAAKAIVFSHPRAAPYMVSLEIPEARPYLRSVKPPAEASPVKRRQGPAAAILKQPQKSVTADVAKLALTTALVTGELQEWSSGSVHGYVVPGPQDIAAGISCRNYSILARKAGSPDVVKNGRQCGPAKAISDTATEKD